MKKIFKIGLKIFIGFILLGFNVNIADFLSHNIIKLHLKIDKIISYESGNIEIEEWKSILSKKDYIILSGIKYDKDKHIPFNKILQLSPFPPFYYEFLNLENGRKPVIKNSSIIIESNKKKYQITIVNGESSTTPSIIVPKIRGNETYWGDHYPTYMFVTDDKNELNPNIYDAQWKSIEIAGNEDIRELLFGLMFLLIEIIIYLIILYSRKLCLKYKKK